MSGILRILPGCLIAAALLVAVGQTHGQGRLSPRPEVRGMVKKVDTAAGTITVGVSDGRQEAQDKTYPLVDEVEVAITTGVSFRGPFAEGKLADLAPGALVSLTLSADSQKVESILAEGPTVRGVLKKWGMFNGHLVVGLLTAGPGERGEAAETAQSYEGKRGVEVGIDDGRGRRYSIKEGKLGDLKLGAMITLRLSPDQKIQSILAEGPNLTGIVKSLDSASGSLTLVLGPARGAQVGEERTLSATDAVVLLDDGRGRRLSLREGKLADVPTGAAGEREAQRGPECGRAPAGRGTEPAVMIRSVDPGQRTITFSRPMRGENAEEKTLPLAADARIVVDGSEKALADFRVNDGGQFAILRLSLDQKSIQGVQAATGR